MRSDHATGVVRTSRDPAIDTMRGVAVLMVIGIHTLPPADTGAWVVAVDAALRPSVALFLFLSGFLTGRNGRAAAGRRLRAALVPYAVAFAAAYAYMAARNPHMDHRPWVAAARFFLGYVFVYYFVFVYVCCTIALWGLLRIVDAEGSGGRRLTAALVGALAAALFSGAYLDPLLVRLDVPAAVIEEARLRDVPFWFGFVALGMLVARSAGPAGRAERGARVLRIATICAFGVYTAIRLWGIGDAAAYDSVAYFVVSGLFCVTLVSANPASTSLAFVGSGSYFVFLWHIFPVRMLADSGVLSVLAPAPAAFVAYMAAVAVVVAALGALRRLAPPALAQGLGA